VYVMCHDPCVSTSLCESQIVWEGRSFGEGPSWLLAGISGGSVRVCYRLPLLLATTQSTRATALRSWCWSASRRLLWRWWRTLMQQTGVQEALVPLAATQAPQAPPTDRLPHVVWPAVKGWWLALLASVAAVHSRSRSCGCRRSRVAESSCVQWLQDCVLGHGCGCGAPLPQVIPHCIT
jgi:hypothetical protein